MNPHLHAFLCKSSLKERKCFVQVRGVGLALDILTEEDMDQLLNGSNSRQCVSLNLGFHSMNNYLKKIYFNFQNDKLLFVDENVPTDLSSKYSSCVEMCPNNRFTLHLMEFTRKHFIPSLKVMTGFDKY